MANAGQSETLENRSIMPHIEWNGENYSE